MTNHTSLPETEQRILTVTEIPDVQDVQGSVTIYQGLDSETGDSIFFGVDHRVSESLIGHLLLEGEIEVSVEPWQIIGKGAF